MSTQAYRCRILHFVQDPTTHGEQAYEYLPDGVLVIEQGYVSKLGPADVILPNLSAHIPIEHFPDYLLIPGFIDTHTHYPQTEMIGAYGKNFYRRINPQRHHHRLGVWYGTRGIGECLVQRMPKSRLAHDCRQSVYGPQCTQRFMRRRRFCLPTIPRINSTLARRRALVLRTHPTVCADLQRAPIATPRRFTQ
jgi:hypothetical protein